jgi:hypothetical protein
MGLFGGDNDFLAQFLRFEGRKDKLEEKKKKKLSK